MLQWLEKTSAARVALVWIALLASWEAAYRIVGWKAWLFPAPSHVVDATLHMLNLRSAFGDPLRAGWPWPSSGAPLAGATGSFWTSPLPGALAISAGRLLIGFVFSLVLGGALGLAMWRYRFVDALLGPVFLGLQTLPSVCWVPLAVLTLGIREISILFVLVMGSFFAIAIALRDGLRQVPPIYKRAALMLGARRWTLYRYIMLPAALPAAAGSLRQGFSFAWRSLMGGELVFMLQWRGVGFLLNIGREFADVAQVVAVMACMVLIGTLADRLIFAQIERRVRARFGLV
ncbi:MAG: ABC transporter permease subunit [Phycisphaerae bacterium]